MIELLTTKLFIPRPRKNLVSRPRLVERLNAGLDKKLTLIAAPAGFGKTTLLSEWIPQSPRCVTWLSLDASDNDPVKFLAYFVKSLQRLRADLGEGAFSLLQSPQALPITSILTTLINDIAAFSDAFCIVLDDYHVIESQAIHDGLIFLTEHQPDNMHLLITTRMDPPLALARLRARDQLSELRANDLRFTVDESTAFLNRAMGLNLSSEQVTALEARTEGWIAGLQIAALSMQGQEDISGFVAAFSGSHRHILGYLANEVIDKQPERILNFLLKTSILERLCGPLCDAVTGDTGGQAILEEMEHANLFIARLDDEGKWYRYHHLFAEVLQGRLRHAQRALIPELHRRASTWYEEHGNLTESVNHALAAQDFDLAAHLIEQISGAMWQRGEVRMLQIWLAALPLEIRRIHPKLCLAQAWGALAVGQLKLVESSVMEAAEIIGNISEEDSRVLRAEVDAIKSMLAAFRQDSAQAIDLAHQSLEHLPEEDHFLRGLVTYSLGRAFLSQGDLPAASQNLREAATFSLKAGDLSTASFALNALGVELQIQGRLREAAECYQEVIQAIHNEGRPTPVTSSSGAFVWLGMILYEWDQLDEATEAANRGIALSRPFSTSAGIFIGYLVLTNVLKARNDFVGAIDSLRNAEIAVRSDALLKDALRMIEAVRAQLSLAQGVIADAAQWAEAYEHDLHFPASGDWTEVRQFRPIFDYECLTLVRVRIAQGQREAALQLLARLQEIVEAGARKSHRIELLILRALLLQMQSNKAESISNLEEALTQAEPEGFIRSFVDEGEPMRLLLLEYQKIIKKKLGESVDGESLRLLTYTDQLLAAFPQLASTPGIIGEKLIEPLSERELHILHLIAAGRSNQEIAEMLVIALSTVKSHINNLYGKLGTNRRTEAIAIARDLGLLSE
ncbi:MAG: HTH-type transcriptional regulator MalT [Anaerolineales bacterium]|nr:HTH-type transcriptional regulator MalT [Anaerolineales bacterium]WKZ47063.1 MAG: LuxR C-terminal-related transcriptional regulator [Anaerolineales bacterium]